MSIQIPKLGPFDHLKKLWPFVLAVVLVLVSATYFGVKLISREGKVDVIDEGAVEITYWSRSISSVIMEKIVDEFNVDNPNIIVRYEKRPSDDYHILLQSRLQTNNPEVTPDVFEVESYFIPEIEEHLAYADKYDSVTFEQNFFHAARKVCSQGGFVYCIPVEFNGLVMIYNQDMLKSKGIDSIPDDWIDFKLMADGITVRHVEEVDRREKTVVDVSGVALGTGSSIANSPEILLLLAMQNGVPVNVPQQWGEIKESKGQVATDLYTSFYKENIWGDRFASDIDAFLRQQTAIFFGFNEDVALIAGANPSFTYRTIMPPQVSGQVNLAKFSVNAVSLSSEQKEASWRFVEFMGSDKAQRILMQGEEGQAYKKFPARKDLLHETGSVRDFDGLSQIFISADVFFVPNYIEAREEFVVTIDLISLEGKSSSALLGALVTTITRLSQ